MLRPTIEELNATYKSLKNLLQDNRVWPSELKKIEEVMTMVYDIIIHEE